MTAGAASPRQPREHKPRSRGASRLRRSSRPRTDARGTGANGFRTPRVPPGGPVKEIPADGIPAAPICPAGRSLPAVCASEYCQSASKELTILWKRSAVLDAGTAHEARRWTAPAARGARPAGHGLLGGTRNPRFRVSKPASSVCRQPLCG